MPKSSSSPRRASDGIDPKQRKRGLKGASVESTPKKRRRFAASEKSRLVRAADKAIASGERGALGALLRKEGIYRSHVSTWRKQLKAEGAAGLEARKPGRKPKLDAKDRELVAANKELAALRHRLKVANAVIELQKKAHEVLNIALPTLPETNEND